jgi:hypothetical protein
VAFLTLYTPYAYDTFNGEMAEKNYRPSFVCITVTMMMFIRDTALGYNLTRRNSVELGIYTAAGE